VDVGARLHQHVAPADARVGHPVFDVSRHVPGFDQDETVPPVGRRDDQFTRLQFVFGDEMAGAREERQRVVLHPAF
jgi:hypothetical protein